MVVRTDIDNCSSILTVTITRDELKPKLDAELKRLSHKLPVKGFRSGQVPKDYLKKMYGSAVFTETLNEMFSGAMVEYIKESGLSILGQPLPVENQPAKFTMNISNPDPEYKIDYEIGFVPRLEIQGIDKGHSYERLTVSDLDELAEADLQYARKRGGIHSIPMDDIQENDIVKIAARELDSVDGIVKDGGWETTMTFYLKSMAAGELRSKLLTQKTGDSLRFNARTAENHEKEEMYRKYILSLPVDDERAVGDWFEGIIEEVTRVEEADLNEEFYKDYFGAGVANKEEAISRLKIGILQFYDDRADSLLFRSIKERLMELNEIELPDKFLKRWLGITNQGKIGPEQIEREYPAFAKNLRWSIIRDDIIEEFGVKVTDQELRASYANRVRQYFRSELPEHFVADSIDRLMKDEQDVENTRHQIEADKMLKALVPEVNIVDKPLPSEEFHQIIETITAKAKAEVEQGSELGTTLDEEP